MTLAIKRYIERICTPTIEKRDILFYVLKTSATYFVEFSQEWAFYQCCYYFSHWILWNKLKSVRMIWDVFSFKLSESFIIHRINPTISKKEYRSSRLIDTMEKYRSVTSHPNDNVDYDRSSFSHRSIYSSKSVKIRLNLMISFQLTTSGFHNVFDWYSVSLYSLKLPYKRESV